MLPNNSLQWTAGERLGYNLALLARRHFAFGFSVMTQFRAVATIMQVLLLVSASGCGSIMGHTSGQTNTIYVGVRYDIAAVRGEPDIPRFLMFDFPFSTCADTILLPWDIGFTLAHREPATTPQKNPEPGGAANRSQPVEPEANGASAAAGSGG